MLDGQIVNRAMQSYITIFRNAMLIQIYGPYQLDLFLVTRCDLTATVGGYGCGYDGSVTK